MQTSTTLSESVWTNVWSHHSPLVELTLSDRGTVFAKLDGMLAGGSYFDRIAERLFEELAPHSKLVAIGLGRSTASFAAAAAAHRLSLRVLALRSESKRLLALIRRLGADVVLLDSDADLHGCLSGAVDAGYVFLDANDSCAHMHALWNVIVEVMAQRPDIHHFVAVDWTGDSAAVEASLGLAGDGVVIHWSPRDNEQPVVLDGSTAALRERVGHDRGVLLGPLGASLVADAALHSSRDSVAVCALVPDGGHRYLGWW